MKFVVTRTSQNGSDYPPCPEAVKGKIAVWDRRTLKSAEEYDKKWGHEGKWHERGTDHRFWYNKDRSIGGIKRRLPDMDCWYVEISCLEELIAFVDRYSRIIIKREMHDEICSIEIYDDYRE
jgi:hypothetical protein